MSTGWIVLPEGLGWLKPRLDALADLYCQLRGGQDVIPAFEQTLADALDERDYDRIQSFFDGEHDAVYGPDAGAHARASLREALEAVCRPAGDAVVAVTTEQTHDVSDVDRFYGEDPRRRSSREIQFGNSWLLGKRLTPWFVSWIEDTGELISVGPMVTRRGDGHVKAVPEVGPMTGEAYAKAYVEILCVESDLSRLRYLVTAWENQQGRPDSYRWLRERVGAD